MLNREKVFDELAAPPFPSVGMAVEMIEDKLLLAAMEVRSKWLLFEPLKKMHFTHVQKTSYEAFEEVFGGELGTQLSTFTARIKLGEWRNCGVGHDRQLRRCHWPAVLAITVH